MRISRSAWRVGAATGCLIASLGWFAVSQAQASPITLFSSLGNGGSTLALGSSRIVQSFETGSTPLVFQGATLDLSNTGGSAASYDVSIDTSVNGQPGTVLTTIATNQTINAGSTGNVVLSAPNNGLVLAPQTTYFLEVSSSSSSLQWALDANHLVAIASDISPTPLFSALQSTDGGATWAPVQSGGSPTEMVAAINATDQGLPADPPLALSAVVNTPQTVIDSNGGYIQAITSDTWGNTYVVSTRSGGVVEVPAATPSTTTLLPAALPSSVSWTAMAVCHGDLVLAGNDSSLSSGVLYTIDLANPTTATQFAAFSPEVNSYGQIACDSSGSIYLDGMDSSIVEVTPNATTSEIATNVASPVGLTIVGHSLFVISGGSLMSIDLTTHSATFVSLSGASSEACPGGTCELSHDIWGDLLVIIPGNTTNQVLVIPAGSSVDYYLPLSTPLPAGYYFFITPSRDGYWISGYNSNYSGSLPFIDLSMATSPAPPALQVTAADSSATVSITPPLYDGGSAVTQYTVTLNPGNLQCVTTGADCSFSNLANGTSYQVTVVAHNGIGDSRPATTTVTPQAPAPTTTVTTVTASTTSTTILATTTTRPQVTPSTVPSTSTIPTTTTTLAPNVPPTAASQTSASPFSDQEPQNLILTSTAQVGSSTESAQATVSASGLLPNSPVELAVHSTTVTLLRTTADSHGNLSSYSVSLPALDPGIHAIVLTGTGPQGPLTDVIGLRISASSIVIATTAASLVTNFQGDRDPRLIRALNAQRSIYDPKAHPHTTAALVIALGSLGTLLAGHRLSSPESRSSEDRKKKLSLAQLVTKKLKATARQSDAWGDRSLLWRTPAHTHVDRWSANWPDKVGKYSSFAARILLDGTWLRAMFGSAGLLLPLLGAGIGLASVLQSPSSVLVPSFATLAILITLSALDASTGVAAWLVMTVGGLFKDQLHSVIDLRTVLGLLVALSSAPLLAHVIRPLRRVVNSRSDIIERCIDYLLMPLFLAFAVSSMVKALNGLSGLTLFTPAQIELVRWLVLAAIIVRLLAEDVVVHYFPQRLLSVYPEKLPSQRRSFSLLTASAQFGLFLFVATPYFGLTWRTILVAGIALALNVGKLFENSLPNFPVLYKFLPRGFTMFVTSLIVGAYLNFNLVGNPASQQRLLAAYVWLAIPGLLATALGLFAREGEDWGQPWRKRLLGFPLWLVGAGMTTGLLVLFS